MSTDKNNFDIATQVVHSGEKDKTPTGQPTTTPIYASATYTYESMDDIDKVFAGEKPGYIYTRYGNPTVAALEDVIRTVEGGARSEERRVGKGCRSRWAACHVKQKRQV